MTGIAVSTSPRLTRLARVVLPASYRVRTSEREKNLCRIEAGEVFTLRLLHQDVRTGIRFSTDFTVCATKSRLAKYLRCSFHLSFSGERHFLVRVPGSILTKSHGKVFVFSMFGLALLNAWRSKEEREASDYTATTGFHFLIEKCSIFFFFFLSG
jgi:hypothetical protein